MNKVQITQFSETEDGSAFYKTRREREINVNHTGVIVM